MDVMHPAARAVDIIGTRPPAREPFDPAGLLEGRKPPPLPYATGPSVVVAKEFDPADFLGARALRGAFNLATVKPLVTMIGGVEMVTVPASAYAYALRQVGSQELPPEIVEQAVPTPDATGMLDLLLSLHAAEVVSTGQLVKATGLDHLAIGDRVAEFASRRPEASPLRYVAPPEAARVDVVPDGTLTDAPEAHGAALADQLPSEAHGAALDSPRPERRPRKGTASHEVP